VKVRFYAYCSLIHGYLGAGKTTFARQLERTIPAIRLSHDEWMVRLYGDNPPIEHFADFYGRHPQMISAKQREHSTIKRS
jgi:predicted kinase